MEGNSTVRRRSLVNGPSRRRVVEVGKVGVASALHLVEMCSLWRLLMTMMVESLQHVSPR